jgi:ribosomal protein L11 methylase PrmA
VSSTPDSLVYGNWIRVRALWVLEALALVCLVLAFAPLPIWMRLCSAVAAVGLSIAFGIPLYAYLAFSHEGGNVQERVYDTLVSALNAPGATSVLDIGAGNGVLSVKLALALPAAHVTGIDSWGPAWEYAAHTCRDNARRAGVADVNSRYLRRSR